MYYTLNKAYGRGKIRLQTLSRHSSTERNVDLSLPLTLGNLIAKVWSDNVCKRWQYLLAL